MKDTLAYRLQKAFLRYNSNVAISIGSENYTYADLHRASMNIANELNKRYQGDYSPVAIPGGKSFSTYASICGALLSSRAYMPLNSKFPEARNKKMLELSAALKIEKDEAGLMKEAGVEELQIVSRDEDTAYLLFTSGTTGIPKGVPVSNKNVCAYLDHVLSEWDFTENDRFSHTFDLTFDLSVHDLFVCWLSGSCLCVPAEDAAFKLATYIKEQRISVWFSVPSAAVLMNRMRLLKPGALDGIRLSFFCGEPLTTDIADKWLASTSGKELVNLYGPTEATIAISSYSWNERNKKSMNAVASLGNIFNEQEYIILDPGTASRAEGDGELCLGGSQIVKGYLGDEGLTEKYFIHLDEYPGKTWYRTGDLVHVDRDGDLFYLGRKDTEVKISGYRVNLLEVDAVVRNAAGNVMVASVVHEKRNPVIISFVSGLPGGDENKLLQACREELPWYMIPERIIFVEEMPLNVNGKIDRNKLKQMLDG